METIQIVVCAVIVYVTGVVVHAIAFTMDDEPKNPTPTILWAFFWPIVTPLWLITWPARRLLRWRRNSLPSACPACGEHRHPTGFADWQPWYEATSGMNVQYRCRCCKAEVWREDAHDGRVAGWRVRTTTPEQVLPEGSHVVMAEDGRRFQLEICTPKPHKVPYGSKPSEESQPVRLDAHRELEARVARLEGARVRAFRQTLPRKPCKNGVVFCSEAMTPGVFLFDGVDMWFRHDGGGCWQECGTYYATPEGLSDAAYSCDELPHAEALALDAERRKSLPNPPAGE